MAEVAEDRRRLGPGRASDLNALIFSSGIQLEELQTQLDGLRETQSQTVERAEALDPPGPLREQHQDMIKALQLRVSGLNGLAQRVRPDHRRRERDEAGKLLAQQSARLIASDVNWEDFFEAPAKERHGRPGRDRRGRARTRSSSRTPSSAARRRGSSSSSGSRRRRRGRRRPARQPASPACASCRASTSSQAAARGEHRHGLGRSRHRGASSRTRATARRRRSRSR